MNTPEIIRQTGLRLDEVMDDLDMVEAFADTPELRALAASLNRRLADALAVLLLLREADDLRASLVARLDQVRAELTNAEKPAVPLERIHADNELS